MKRHKFVSAIAIVAMVATACGSDSKSGGTSAAPTTVASAPTTSGATESSAATSSSAASDSSVVTESSAATESSAGSSSEGTANSPVAFSDENKFKAKVDRTGETIKIGVTNDEGATFTTPEMRPAILTAIDYINANGGINGAKLDPDVCVSDATPDGAINCANQFVEDGVNLVTYGAEINIDAALKIYEDANIAIISDYAYNQTPSDHVWALTSPAASFSLYAQLALKDAGSTKPAFLPIEAPVFHYHADIWPKWSAKIGTHAIVGPFVDASTADWSSAVQSVLSDGADGLAYFGPANGAVSIVTAARQLGFKGPIITTDASYFHQVNEADVQNNYAITPRFGSVAAAAAAPKRIADNLAIYSKAMTDAGHADIIEGNAENQFSTTIDIATILETIPEGPIDFKSISAALSEDRELPGFDAPDFNCGGKTWPAAPSFCRAYQLVFKVNRSGDAVTLTTLKSENGGVYNDPALNAEGSHL
jgi:branched-chain amino acid transport system substrate-binding protein